MSKAIILQYKKKTQRLETIPWDYCYKRDMNVVGQTNELVIEHDIASTMSRTETRLDREHCDEVTLLMLEKTATFVDRESSDDGRYYN